MPPLPVTAGAEREEAHFKCERKVGDTVLCDYDQILSQSPYTIPQFYEACWLRQYSGSTYPAFLHHFLNPCFETQATSPWPESSVKCGPRRAPNDIQKSRRNNNILPWQFCLAISDTSKVSPLITTHHSYLREPKVSSRSRWLPRLFHLPLLPCLCCHNKIHPIQTGVEKCSQRARPGLRKFCRAWPC